MSGGGLGHRNKADWWTVSTRDKAYLQPLNKTDISVMAKQIFPIVDTYGCFQKYGYPKKWKVYNGKPYCLMDDLGGKPHYFWKHPYQLFPMSKVKSRQLLPGYPFGFSSFPATSQQPLLLPLPTGISKDWREPRDDGWYRGILAALQMYFAIWRYECIKVYIYTTKRTQNLRLLIFYLLQK